MNKEKNKKEYINLYQREIVSSRFPRKVITSVIVFVFAFLFIWFGIVDRYIEVNSLEGIAEEEASNLEIIKTKREEMDNVEDDYLRYSKDYLSSKERQIISRNTVFDKIDEYLIDECDVAKIQLTDNELVTTLYGATMQKSSVVIDEMMHDPDGCIAYAKTRNAKHEYDTSSSSIDMIIAFASEEDRVISFEE